MPIALAQDFAVYEITASSLELALENIRDNNEDSVVQHTAFASEFFATNTIRTGSDSEIDKNIHLHLLDANTFASLDDYANAKHSIDNALMLIDDVVILHSSKDFVEILAVAEKYYREGIIYENKDSINIATYLVMRIAEISPSPTIDELVSSMTTHDPDYAKVADSVAYAQRTLYGAPSVKVNDSYLYLTIDSLYDSVFDSVDSGMYDEADDSAVEAYLDNFEYLEAPIAAVDEKLMRSLEIAMRQTLRELLADKAPPEQIRAHIEDNILPDLKRAQQMTANTFSQSVIVSTLAEPGRAISRMGSASEEQKGLVRAEIDDIRIKLQLSEKAHEIGDYDLAYEHARSAYLDSYELIEIPLRVINPDFTLEVEAEFAKLRNLVREKADKEDVRLAIVSIERNLDESERFVSGTGELAPAIAFTSSFAIIFREGLESVLILGAILSYLEASRNTRFRSHIIYGVIAGIGATALTWFVAQFLIDISGVSREYIEAIAALSATAVLFYVSFWVLNKIEHKKWMEFVKAKVWQATTTGSATVFVLLSFTTVYREGFETVLFYQAMISFAKYSESYVILGLILGLVSLFVVYYVMRRLSRRLPLRALFGLTMGVGAYLSIAFLGNAVRELQLLDILPYTSMLGVIPRLDVSVATLTGIYPTLETTIAQIMLLSVYLAGSTYVLIIRPRRIVRLAAMRKSRRDA